MRPRRIQLSRRRGYRKPEGAVVCTRPGRWKNPFRVGGYFMIGDPDPRAVIRMEYCETYVRPPEPGFTLIETREQSLEWFKRYVATWSAERIATVRRELGGRDLCCWCRLDQECQVDTLLVIANPELGHG